MKVEWYHQQNSALAEFIFGSTLTKEDSKIVAKEWRTTFDQHSYKSFDILLDCSSLSDSNRTLFQLLLKITDTSGGQINSMCIITTSKSLKFTALFIDLFTKFHIRVVTSMDEIYESNRSALSS